jgi:hypothetical protein
VPEQALLKIIKRWKRYLLRGDWTPIPRKTRGFYVLYQYKHSNDSFDVVYIGVAGLGQVMKQGIAGRLRAHDRKMQKSRWSHYSFMEVHDNVAREDLRELESLLLSIFRHDSRIKLENVQKSSRTLYKLRQRKMWAAAS